MTSRLFKREGLRKKLTLQQKKIDDQVALEKKKHEEKMTL
jgi:hypothetical protein